ncbi:MAG: farnesyl diphosphate synthase [Deferribacterota bacterium]|nr:farnesyl diphosphate synthase [Deferribacterota bacterium]
MFNVESYIKFWADKVDTFLEECLGETEGNKLLGSMRYSLFAGGKRLRPTLIYSSYGIFDSNFEKVTPFAAAVEMLHTYSLIHDDLPAMDNETYRRGKLSNHKVYGEDIAILAGDALLTKAFELMLDRKINSEIEIEILLEAAHKLSCVSGCEGLVYGQYLDISNNLDSKGCNKLVEQIYLLKTAKLISYCVEIGAILGYGTDIDKEKMREYGKNIGIAFQIVDDILDITSNVSQLGKDVGKDKELKKITYPAIYGIDKSKKYVSELINEAVDVASFYGNAAKPLVEIAKYIENRNN